MERPFYCGWSDFLKGEKSCPLLPPFIVHEIRKIRIITAAWRNILKPSSKSMMLRRYFLYNRKLLADLSRSAWESLKVFIQDAVPENDPVPGAVIAVQTFGDFLGFNPHGHILVTDGCFYGDGGMFRVAPPLELKNWRPSSGIRCSGCSWTRERSRRR